jgi:hypothetical protein
MPTVEDCHDLLRRYRFAQWVRRSGGARSNLLTDSFVFELTVSEFLFDSYWVISRRHQSTGGPIEHLRSAFSTVWK